MSTTNDKPEPDIVFMDTETLGLDPDAPIWEFAAIRRAADGVESAFHCFIDHYPLPWIDTLPDQFAQDYRKRYNPEKAVRQWDAAGIIRAATQGAHVVGAVPNFDTERLQRLLLRLDGGRGLHSREPWFYHLIDIENVAAGYLTRKTGQPVLPPYDSNELSAALGVNPDAFQRHTAMGDVQWVMAQWDVIMGGGDK